MLNLRLNDCFMDFGGFPIMRRSAKFTVLGVLGAVLLLSGCTTYVSVASDPVSYTHLTLPTSDLV